MGMVELAGCTQISFSLPSLEPVPSSFFSDRDGFLPSDVHSTSLAILWHSYTSRCPHLPYLHPISSLSQSPIQHRSHLNSPPPPPPPPPTLLPSPPHPSPSKTNTPIPPSPQNCTQSSPLIKTNPHKTPGTSSPVSSLYQIYTNPV